nr:immunoglobulin light chain junction region [Macaca mulatta]MOW03113.1 immunoglobulin light chain junction region [Macaca mulatta]
DYFCQVWDSSRYHGVF